MIPDEKNIQAILPTLNFTSGDEYELTLVNRETGERATAETMVAFWAKLDDPQFPWGRYQHLRITRVNFSKEYTHYLCELNSPVFRGHKERRDWLNAALDFLREVGEEFDLVPTGTDLHPHAWAGHFTRDDIPEYPEYLRGAWDYELRTYNSLPRKLLAKALRTESFLVKPSAYAGPVSGRHGHHGGYVNEHEAFWVLTQFLALVPMFVAGTANGPLCVPETASGLEVADSGLASLRPGWWGVLKNTGVGPIFRDRDQYMNWMRAEHKKGNIDERWKLYFYALRRIEGEEAPSKPELVLGTNEYRMQGVQSTPEDILAWAGAEDAAEALLRCLYRLGKPLSPLMEKGPDEQHTRRIDADVAAAARDGLDAVITNPFAKDPADRRKASEIIQIFVEIAESVMDRLHLPRERDHLLWIADGNAGYQRLRRAFRQGDADGALQYLIRSMNG